MTEVKVALENGKVFYGKSFGATGQCCAELVFNTSMTGYQEIMTDPSYAGQAVLMTYPLIGNCGINSQDCESDNFFLRALLVKEFSPVASCWRSESPLEDYMRAHDILGVQGIDTRALTKLIRIEGAIKIAVSTDDTGEKALVEKARLAPGLSDKDLVKKVTCKKPYIYNRDGRYKIAVLDYGVKKSILERFKHKGCAIKVFSADSSKDEILSYKPDGLVFSNGPGDPAVVVYAIKTARQLIGRLPVLGICLGHQIIALALGAKTYKLKFGHHGGNHPVKELRTGRCYITSQNHGFCVDPASLHRTDVEITHINLNDNTPEGLYSKKLCFLTMQFHPEAGPGPNDAIGLFDNFIDMMKGTFNA
ncbi:MAG: glutamine-hydrolyzing carbamoyl-phosphate synthase small subunit [Candidatus Omnitrophica bacterium]|nr:glutamine-hydrolyzing carbamoyl-phosphate synthase small subunit [Candidatus Omnitrophota bacterium]